MIPLNVIRVKVQLRFYFGSVELTKNSMLRREEVQTDMFAIRINTQSKTRSQNINRVRLKFYVNVKKSAADRVSQLKNGPESND